MRDITTCRDGLKYFRNAKKECKACPEDGALENLDWSQYLGLGLLIPAFIGILFLLAGLLKKMGTVIGPVMSLVTFMQIADMQKTLQGKDGCVIDFGQTWPHVKALCSNGALGASNLDTSVLQSENSPFGLLLSSVDPSCLFDFNYDQQWAAVVLSPLLLTLVLAFLFGLRIFVAVLASWWLPPWARPELGIEIQLKPPCLTAPLVWQLIDENRDEYISGPPGWSKCSAFITLVLFPLWLPMLLLWWLLWAIMTCCGKCGSDACFLIDKDRGPGRNSNSYPELKYHGLMNWCGLEKIAFWIADIDVEELLYRVISMQLVYMWSAYVYLIRWTTAPFYCSGTGSEGPHYMIAQPAVACTDAHHIDHDNPLSWLTFNQLWWASVFFSIQWIGGIPGTFFYILFNAKHSRGEGGGERSRLKDREFVKIFGFVTTKMKEGSICYCWDVVILVRKGLLAILGQMFSTNLATFSYISLLVMMISGFLQTYYLPFALVDANFVETALLVSSSLLYLLQLYEQQHESGDFLRVFVSIVVGVNYVGTVLVIIGRASGALWLHSREEQKLCDQLENDQSFTNRHNRAPDEVDRAVQNYKDFHTRAVTTAIVDKQSMILRGELKGMDGDERRRRAEAEQLMGPADRLDPQGITDLIVEGQASAHRERLKEISLGDALDEADELDCDPVMVTAVTGEAQERGLIPVVPEPTRQDLAITTLGFEGWLAKELDDKDREMIDKSKLLLTDAWTQAERDSVKITEGKVAREELRSFCGESSQQRDAKQLFKDAETFASHFKADVRPQVFARIMHMHGISADIARAKRDRGRPNADTGFLDKLIQRLQEDQRRHAVQKELLFHFVDNLRATDEKQKWFIVRKLRKWNCCPCCSSGLAPGILRPYLPAWYVNLVEEAHHTVNDGQDWEGPAYALNQALDIAIDANNMLGGGGEGGGAMLPAAFADPDPGPEAAFATRHASPNNSGSDSDGGDW